MKRCHKSLKHKRRHKSYRTQMHKRRLINLVDRNVILSDILPCPFLIAYFESLTNALETTKKYFLSSFSIEFKLALAHGTIVAGLQTLP